jgi:asparagine synthase (glutamine-hydrolysing)
MCGICGVIDFNNQPVKKETVKTMMLNQKHRGPDDNGVFIENNVGLGFVRLSILDLSDAGHQPMFSHDKRFVIVFNGEIYNYIELREELKLFGYEFKTNSDTEVLIASYQEWGEKCQDKFNGMWSFVIFDRYDKTIFASRDRFGIKPFYYCIHNNKLFFASEIQTILSVLPVKPTANSSTLFDFMLFNKTEQSEDTFFQNIKKLLHGYCFKIKLNNGPDNLKITPERWYNLKERVAQNIGFKNPEEYKFALKNSIQLRLRSDVPVGVCFSGGLDSSSIVSLIIDDFEKKDLNTFSAVYDKSFYGDESEFIDLYKNKPGERHYTTPDAESLIKDLKKFITCHGEPLPSTNPYAQYKVMELARKNVVVTLDGQGADEQLAGYHYFFGFYFKDLLINFKIFRLFKEILFYLKIHKSLFAIKTFLFFLLPQKIRIKAKASSLNYLNKSFIKNNSSQNIIAGNLYGSRSLKESLINHFEYKLEHLLKWEDRNSMFFSIESRVPFLDYQLVEKTLASDSGMIIKNGMTKHILRESMLNTLPEKIRLRIDKNGFITPQDDWFRTPEWKEKITEIINSNSFRSRKIVNYKKAQNLYNKHLSGKINIAKEIWKWVHLELWFREYID